MSRLSIIVPVYNKEEYVSECIQSILNQSHKDFELFLVNDGSTDSSGAICELFAKKDSRIIVINQQNQGVSAARNAALEICTGTYIGFVDADDTVDSDMYEVLLENITQHAADISICGVRKIFPAKIELYYGTEKLKTYDTNSGIAALLNKEFSRSVYDKIFRADLLKDIRFEGRINEDTFFNYLALNESKKTVFHDVIKYNYIIRENSVSMSKFSSKYMDTINLSRKMVEICAKRTPTLLDKAQYFDFITNISALNLIILSEKSNFISEYMTVVSNLKSYYHFSNKKEIRRKHRYAITLISINSNLYGWMMKLYCILAKSDVYNKVSN